MVPLSWYLLLAALLFAVGLYAVMARRNLIGMLMGLELMLNAINLTLIAFWRYLHPYNPGFQALVIFVLVVAASEAAVGLALILAVFRIRETEHVDELNLLRW
jgi:NADH-quinone oxidoreductase subunit K